MVLREVLREIETLRKQLVQCSEENSKMAGEEVLRLSRELDVLINEYYKLTYQEKVVDHKQVNSL